MSSSANGAPNPTSTVPVPAVARPAAAAVGAAVAAAPAAAPFSTPALLAAMLKTSEKISDLFFTPGKPPLVEINGKLTPAGSARTLTTGDPRGISARLMGGEQPPQGQFK